MITLCKEFLRSPFYGNQFNIQAAHSQTRLALKLTTAAYNKNDLYTILTESLEIAIFIDQPEVLKQLFVR
jgi:hypothetical protein